MNKIIQLTSSAIVAMFFVTACSMAPKLQTPPLAEHQQNWASTPEAINLNSELTQDVSQTPWQEFFTEPQLQQLLELALNNNFDLRLAALNVELAQARHGISKGNFLPKISASLQSQRSNGVSNNPQTSYSVGLGIIGYELDFFGKIKSLKDAALAQYLASQENVKTAQLSLLSQVASSYLIWSANQQVLELAKNTLNTRQQSFELNQLRFTHGVISEIQLRQAQAELAAIRAEIAKASQQLQQDRNALELLIGQPLPAELQQPQTPLSQQSSWLAKVPANLPAQVLVQRPDIIAAEQQLRAANANIGVARAAFFPSISLTTNIERISGDFSSLFDGSKVWSFVPRLNLPIFTAGANRANLKISKVQQQIALTNYEKTLQTAFYEVSNALTGLESWQQRLTATLIQQDASAKAFELAEKSYQHGVISYLELLNAQRDLYQVQQIAIQTELGMLLSRISLYKSLGGGWRNS